MRNKGKAFPSYLPTANISHGEAVYHSFRKECISLFAKQRISLSEFATQILTTLDFYGKICYFLLEIPSKKGT